MNSKFQISRHPGESRDPVSKILGDTSIKHWIPAFAGMTSSENKSLSRVGHCRSIL